MKMLPLAAAIFALPALAIAQTAGTYAAFGSGCGTSGVRCGGHNPSGSILRATTLPNEYAYPFTITRVTPCTGARFYTKHATAGGTATVIARLYRALAAGAPDPMAIDETLMTIGDKEQMWQCSFNKVHVLQAGDYFVAFEPYLPTTTTAVVLTSQMTDGTNQTTNRAYWRRPSSTTFAPTGIVTHPWFDVMCGGSPLPLMKNTGVPTVNKTFTVDLSQAPTGAPALNALGLSKTNFGPLPLPLDLSAIAPGCYLFSSLDLVSASVVSGMGTATVTWGIPNNNSLVGLQFYNQYLIVRPAANTLGLLFSNAGEGKIGN